MAHGIGSSRLGGRCGRQRAIMASPPPSLADELKSLRIDRGPARRSLPRWVPVAVAIALAAALALIGWRALGGRLFAPEVDTATVALITPAQGAQLLVATGYVVPQRKANISPRIGGRGGKIFVEGGPGGEARQEMPGWGGGGDLRPARRAPGG